MKQSYRIKKCVIANHNTLITSMQDEEIKHHDVYHVQKRFLGFLWINIKSFEDCDNDWWAWACAQNLLDKLNEED